MKKILVTTDLSEQSQVAFPVAAALAKAFRAEIVLVAIIEDPAQAAMIYALDFPVHPDLEIQQQLKNKVTDDLQRIKEKFFTEVETQAIVHEAHAPVHTEILKLAQELNVNLIAIATHGRTGLSRILIGSVTEKVIRESKIPVLTIPSLK